MKEKYTVKMTDDEIIDFLGKYRADGNLKHDLLRHRLMRLNIWINPFCVYKKDLQMIKEWIRRLKHIKETRTKTWLND